MTKGTASTLLTWRAGPMGFDWEHLTEEECDKKHDEMLAKNAKQMKGKPDVQR